MTGVPRRSRTSPVFVLASMSTVNHPMHGASRVNEVLLLHCEWALLSIGICSEEHGRQLSGTALFIETGECALSKFLIVRIIYFC